MKKAQSKTIFITFLTLMLLASVIYAVGTILVSPTDTFTDDDGFLDLRASCDPTAYDGFTSYNISNATLWINADGSWDADKMLFAVAGIPNATYYFNFTNYVNETAEGTYQWNVNCEEENSSTTTNTKSAFAGNRTIYVAYAKPTVTATLNETTVYDLDGHEISLQCTASPSGGWSIENVSLMTSILGGLSWTLNETHIPTNPGVGGQVVVNFTINKFGNESIPDGTDLLYGCSVYQNKTLGDELVNSEHSSANQTINIEYPPTVTLNIADGKWFNTTTVNLSWTATSKHGSGVAPFPCKIWTNQSGWALRAGGILADNDTQTSQFLSFTDQTAISWNVICSDATDQSNVFNVSLNRTFNVDSIIPTISIGTANDTVFGNETDLIIKFTPTDTNLNVVNLSTNLNGLNMAVNYSNATPNTGEEISVHFAPGMIDGIYNFSVFANDSGGLYFQSVNYTFIVDSIPPNITDITNSSFQGQRCDEWRIAWNTNESANSTLYIDTDSDVADGTIVTNVTKSTSHQYIFDFNLNSDIVHYFNITSCDIAGNCNTSNQYSFRTPASVCAGWSQYAVYDAKITLSTIQNQSEADLVYIWNSTAQDWVFYTAGLTTNQNVVVGRDGDYNVVHLFENTNSTWTRNTSNDGQYEYNISEGSNFVAVPTDYTFGNLTQSFMNSSQFFPSTLHGNHTGVANDSTYGPFNFTFFAGFNNSKQDYVSHIFNFTWANATVLEPCPDRNFLTTCMETFWVAGDFNVTWNGTQINVNWTR